MTLGNVCAITTYMILRKCVGCGELKPREDMIKITKEHISEQVFLNPNPKTFGRSVYLCYNQSCIEQAFKKNKLNRVLKTSAHLQKEDLISLLENRKGQLDGQFKS